MQPRAQTLVVFCKEFVKRRGAETEHDQNDQPARELQPERMPVIADDLLFSRRDQHQREADRKDETVDRARPHEQQRRLNLPVLKK